MGIIILFHHFFRFDVIPLHYNLIDQFLFDHPVEGSIYESVI
jgi:hypothetical protein